jgi:hypothetical protein
VESTRTDLQPRDHTTGGVNPHFHIDQQEVVAFLESAPPGHLIRTLPHLNLSAEYHRAALSVILARLHPETNAWENQHKTWAHFCETMVNRSPSVCSRLERNYNWYVEQEGYNVSDYFGLHRDCGWQKLATLRERRLAGDELRYWLDRIRKEGLKLSELTALLRSEIAGDTRRRVGIALEDDDYHFVLSTLEEATQALAPGLTYDLSRSDHFARALLDLCTRYKVLEQQYE